MTCEELAALEAIRNLKARYFRLVDMRDWAAWRRLFTDDAAIELNQEASCDPEADGAPARSITFSSPDAFVDHARRQIGDCVSVHHGHMPELELVSNREATGLWAMQDILIWPDRVVHGYGYYHERYRLCRDGWRIRAMRLSRLHVATTPTRIGGSGR